MEAAVPGAAVGTLKDSNPQVREVHPGINTKVGSMPYTGHSP